MTATAAADQDFAKPLHALLPRIRARREEIEAARQLPRDLADELTATGIFKLFVPRAFGGIEGSPLDALRIIETIAAADGSTGWCAAIGIMNGQVGGFMPEAGAREVFTDPAQPTALVAEPAGAAVDADGGVRVSGRWRFASGVTYANWVTLGAIMMDNGQPRMTPHGPAIIHVIVPTSEVEIIDTWHVSGLRGTGSLDVAASDVFVPERRVFSLFDSTNFRPEPIYQMPTLSVVAPPTAAVGLGIARAALDEIYATASTRVPALSMVPLAEKPVAQVEMARAEGLLGGARSFLYDTLDDLWQTVQAGEQPTPRQRALVRIAANQTTEAVSRVTQVANTLGGGSAVYNQSSLQRHFRDAEVITHHMTQSPNVWEDAGRVLMGFEPLAPIF